MSNPLAVTYDSVSVSDSYVSRDSFSACKLDSSSVPVCLDSTPSTSACEMNNVNNVSSAPFSVAVPQVMNSDAALSSVIIPETKEKASHFHISCYLKGRHRTVKVAAMVDSGATALFLDRKYADRQKMW